MVIVEQLGTYYIMTDVRMSWAQAVGFEYYNLTFDGKLLRTITA